MYKQEKTTKSVKILDSAPNKKTWEPILFRKPSVSKISCIVPLEDFLFLKTDPMGHSETNMKFHPQHHLDFNWNDPKVHCKWFLTHAQPVTWLNRQVLNHMFLDLSVGELFPEMIHRFLEMPTPNSGSNSSFLTCDPCFPPKKLKPHCFF